MAEWWYITIHRCPVCKASYDTYDSTAPWCDSGLSTAPVVDEHCEDCWDEIVEKDKKEHPEEYEETV